VARMVTLIRGTDPVADRENAKAVPSLAGCPVHDLKERLRDVGLRPTRQRVALGWLLFGRGDRHLSAETLFEEAQRARVPVSLATVYNTLNQFTQVGLLREIAIDGSRTYFDTNISDHHHFYLEGGEGLVDIPAHDIAVANLPPIPDGLEVARVEVVVRLKKKTA
jgi:Fur family transcriptional regulator, iron response regulator